MASMQKRKKLPTVQDPGAVALSQQHKQLGEHVDRLRSMAKEVSIPGVGPVSDATVGTEEATAKPFPA
jgi:hypothetical protein